MAILEVLTRSQRLCEERSVVILMYPPHLEDQVKPGAKITMYHGSVEKNLHTLLQLTTTLYAMGSLKEHMRNSSLFSSLLPTR